MAYWMEGRTNRVLLVLVDNLSARPSLVSESAAALWYEKPQDVIVGVTRGVDSMRKSKGK